MIGTDAFGLCVLEEPPEPLVRKAPDHGPSYG
jgi:hypothetical protein